MWKKINSFDDYEISADGTVRFLGGWRQFGKNRRYAPPCIRSVSIKANGYAQVTLNNGKRIKNFYVHRLVAEAFLPKRDGKTYVNHKDGNKTNNNISNLEWVSASQNIRHAVDVLGLMIGERHSQSKLSVSDIEKIRKSSDSRKNLAEAYGVTPSHIGAIKRRETWTHV